MADLAADSLIAGPGLAIYRDRLSAQFNTVPDSLCEPDCPGLLAVAQDDAHELRADPWEIEPIYLRGSSAEEKRRGNLPERHAIVGRPSPQAVLTTQDGLGRGRPTVGFL